MGNSFIIIEHNMDVIKMADHIIDIGPEGVNMEVRLLQKELLNRLLKQNSLTAKFLKKNCNLDYG